MNTDISSFAVVEGSQRHAIPGARALGRVSPHTPIEITVKIRRKEELPPLNGRPSEIISRDQLAGTYGARQQDVDAVVKVLAGFGLESIGSDLLTRSVDLKGSVADIERAFQIHLFNYSHPDGNFRGYVGQYQVPSALHGVIEHVLGLDTHRVARRRKIPIQASLGALDASAAVSSYFTGAQLANHYHYPPGDGGGETVAILEFGGGYFPSDLEQFCNLANITKVPTVKPISVDGTSTSSTADGAEGEVMLDIEVVASACPASTIVVYFAKFTERGWVKALDAVAKDAQNDPKVVSISWGYAEDVLIWHPLTMKQVNQTLMDVAKLGITVCVAAGDDGSSDGVLDGPAHADFPSSSPYVLSVGGTTIPAANLSSQDIGWFEGDGLRNDNGGSTGGGVSAVFNKLPWQSAYHIPSVNPGAIAGRILPDLAANADWTASPYLLFVDGQPQPNGGTSAATPLIASLITRINATRRAAGKTVIGYVTPVLYQTYNGSTVGAAGCTDVTTGQNNTAKAGGYSAGPGYDAVSGWGTPNGVALLNALNAVI